MRIAVAGGTGFIGTHVVEHLLRCGHAVRLLVRQRARAIPHGVELVDLDLEASIDAKALDGCNAVVNLVGIAHARDPHAFERVHVDVVRHLLDAAQRAGVPRFVHISVVDVPGSAGPYIESKRRGEAIVRESPLDWTILRPSLVYGEGDVALGNLIDGVRTAPMFPVPAGRTGSLQPVDVEDVATAVVRALGDERTHAKTIDVVGPEHLDIRALVRRVADALTLPVGLIPLPRPLMRLAAGLMERILPRPALTRAQLGMLVSGLHGDLQATHALLGSPPRPLAPARIVALAEHRALPAMAFRIVTSSSHRQWLQAFATYAPRLRWLVPLALGLGLALPAALPTVWASATAANMLLLVLVLLAMRGAAWTNAWRPTIKGLGSGLLAATLMVGAALSLVPLLRRYLPALASGADEVYAWADVVSPVLAVPLLLVIVIAEDWVWRGAVALPLCAKWGPIVGSLVAGACFAVAHATLGPPVLVLAAFVAGTAWNLLAVRTRSLFVVSCAHFTWDVAILALAP